MSSMCKNIPYIYIFNIYIYMDPVGMVKPLRCFCPGTSKFTSAFCEKNNPDSEDFELSREKFPTSISCHFDTCLTGRCSKAKQTKTFYSGCC